MEVLLNNAYNLVLHFYEHQFMKLQCSYCRTWWSFFSLKQKITQHTINYQNGNLDVLSVINNEKLTIVQDLLLIYMKDVRIEWFLSLLVCYKCHEGVFLSREK